MAQWANFPWDQAVFSNADETILRGAPAAAENVYANAAGGFSRFPGLRPFALLPGQGRVTLKRYRDDLVAACETGQVFVVDRKGEATNVTGTPISVGERPIFAETEEALIIAAGGPLVRLSSGRTTLLSAAAPLSTHVAYLDGYLIAPERFTGRFRHSNVGEPTVWEDLSVFTAEGKPDPVLACVVTPFRELLLAGPESIEQWETLAGGEGPFFRRWTNGEGIAHPYTLVTDTTGTYGVNLRAEFTRFQAQVSREASERIALSLQAIDDWTGAWAASLAIKGQRFIILQAPNAWSESHGCRGVTFLLDYRAQRWSMLWGYDPATGNAARWPGWSIESCWGRTYVGYDGGIAELALDAYDNLSQPMRCVLRSAHVDEFGPSRIDDVRVRLRRGVGDYGAREPRFSLRMRRDNHDWTDWVWRSMGAPGENVLVDRLGGMGIANTWQMEIACSDPVPFEFTRAQILVERMGW
jgi:hypothetical protein